MSNNSNRKEVLRLQAEVCKSLSNSKRLQIIQELRGGEKTVSELAGILRLKQSNTSHHLAVLRIISVIVPRKECNTVHYCLADTKIADACDLVHQVIADQLRRSERLSSQIRT